MVRALHRTANNISQIVICVSEWKIKPTHNDRRSCPNLDPPDPIVLLRRSPCIVSQFEDNFSSIPDDW